MKTKTLLMVAGVGALGYLLWKKVLTKEQKCKLSGGELVTTPCLMPPCSQDCVNKDGLIIKN